MTADAAVAQSETRGDDASQREDLLSQMKRLGRAARDAAAELAQATPDRKVQALQAAAAAIRARSAEILAANARDMDAARGKDLSAAMLDRLELTPERIEAMARGLESIADFPDPIGQLLERRERPNGLTIDKVTVPLGVIGIIYESRPNVTADAGGLCIKSGNAAILRGGSESAASSAAILEALQDGLRKAGLPAEAIQRLPTTDRAAVGIMLTLNEAIDLIVPRGGRGLIERVQRESRIPVMAHLDGLCHTYIHSAAEAEMARDITVNAKMRRTGIYGATETLLVDRAVATSHLPAILQGLAAADCEVRGDDKVRQLAHDLTPEVPVTAAVAEDWDTEYLEPIISVRVVDDLDEAVAHINRHGSHHTEAIVTADETAAKTFLEKVDAAIVMHNTSTQFADGGEFGMGAEIGISTGKLHARGPVGAEQLTSHKYLVRGRGQVRP